MILRINSMREAVAKLAECEAFEGSRTESKWRGPETYEQTLKGAVSGGFGYGDRMREQLRKVREAMPAGSRSTWEIAPVGVLPSVPAFVAGSPRHMLRQREIQTGAPVRIFASIGASAGISAEAIMLRGAAVAAIVAELSAKRAVDLFAVFEGGTHSGGSTIVTIRLQTRPLDPEALAFQLAAPGVLRRICFELAAPHGFDGPWAYDKFPTSEGWADRVRSEIGMAKSDLYLPPIFLSEVEEMKNNVAGWIKRRVAEVNAA